MEGTNMRALLNGQEGGIRKRHAAEPGFVNLFSSPGIDSQPGGPVRESYLTYRPARAQTFNF
jgi:hypothetical protein